MRAEAVPGARHQPERMAQQQQQQKRQQGWEPGQPWQQHCAPSCSECACVRVWTPSRPHSNSHIAPQSIM